MDTCYIIRHSNPPISQFAESVMNSRVSSQCSHAILNLQKGDTCVCDGNE